MNLSSNAERALAQVAAFSTTLSPDANYYWERHAPRYRHLARVVERLAVSTKLDRVLDVGMGFEVLLLSKLLPRARIDCLGVYEDSRFRPDRAFSFYDMDLNELARESPLGRAERFDLIVFMEVLEHLYTPPDLVLNFLGSLLSDHGSLILSTPNAAWLKNRLKMMRGQNPFALLSYDKKNMDHIREYTKPELETYIAKSGLRCLNLEMLGLYNFNNRKDNIYTVLANILHPSLRRTIFCVCQRRK